MTLAELSSQNPWRRRCSSLSLIKDDVLEKGFRIDTNVLEDRVEVLVSSLASNDVDTCVFGNISYGDTHVHGVVTDIVCV